MGNPDLPPEIVFEIFLRLPAKSVGKCRCLSKTWNTSLSNSRFIKLYLARKSRKESFIILTEYGPLHEVTPSMINEEDGFSRRISDIGDKWERLIGSCDGLVFLQTWGSKLRSGKNMFVVNPITRKQVKIPEPPSSLKENCLIIQYGFGYDISSHDYKVATLADTKGKGYVDVYCLKTRVWKTLDYPFGFCSNAKMVMSFVKGALHWFTNMDPFGFTSFSDHIDRICAFDLATESFREILLPKGLEVRSTFYALAVIRGCVAAIGIFDDGTADVWVMNEYDVRDSWVRFHIHDNLLPDWLIRPVCFVGDEKVLCATNKNCWFVYDLKKRTWKHMVDAPVPFRFTDWMVFEENLISP